MSRLRTYAPLSRRSQKVVKGEPDFRAVYRLVDQRSEGRCEVQIFPDLEGLCQPPGLAILFRCRRRASDHHHLYKPRRSHHDPALIVHLCRHHHDRCAWPFKRGRLVISRQAGTFQFAIRFASEKFTAREEEA